MLRPRICDHQVSSSLLMLLCCVLEGAWVEAEEPAEMCQRVSESHRESTLSILKIREEILVKAMYPICMLY